MRLADWKFPRTIAPPTRPQRAVVAVVIATAAAGILYSAHPEAPGQGSDFGPSWFGARALVHGANPYELVGPGMVYEWRWELLYPVPAMVAVIPLTLLSESAASFTFVWVSAFLLAYGATARSWHLLPMFASEAFASAARLGQWSILMTAAVFMPWLAFLAAAKPQAAIPMVISARSRTSAYAAIVGGIVLTGIGFMLYPGWVVRWLAALDSAVYMVTPITRLGGFLVLLVLLRWRRWEAWLVLSLACLPQTLDPYNVLMLLVIPATFREACLLALAVTSGTVVSYFVPAPSDSLDSINAFFGAITVATAYIPATIIVLRRPNDGAYPAWLVPASRRLQEIVAARTNRRQLQ